jgi:hypothetical protein
MVLFSDLVKDRKKEDYVNEGIQIGILLLVTPESFFFFFFFFALLDKELLYLN